LLLLDRKNDAVESCRNRRPIFNRIRLLEKINAPIIFE
jgi:hypothetical protein